MNYLINAIISGLIYLCFSKFFNKCHNTIKDIYYFYRGSNEEKFICIKPLKNYISSYLLELKDNRFFDEILIIVKRDQEIIASRWYDIDSLKYDAKGEVQLKKYDIVSLDIKYVLKLKFKIFNYRFERKREFIKTEQLKLNNIGVKDLKLCYKIVFKE